MCLTPSPGSRASSSSFFACAEPKHRHAPNCGLLWLLLGDSFLVLFFSLLPLPLALANWSQDALWGFCNALLAFWLVIADILAFLGERKDRLLSQVTIVPRITPVSIFSAGGSLGGVCSGLWLRMCWYSASGSERALGEDRGG
jgi:hypothetical protein